MFSFLVALLITPFLGFTIEIYHKIANGNIISISLFYYFLFSIYFYAAKSISETQIEKIEKKPLSNVDKIMYIYLPIIFTVAGGAFISSLYSYDKGSLLDVYLNCLVVMIIPALLGTIVSIKKYKTNP